MLYTILRVHREIQTIETVQMVAIKFFPIRAADGEILILDAESSEEALRLSFVGRENLRLFLAVQPLGDYLETTRRLTANAATKRVLATAAASGD